MLGTTTPLPTDHNNSRIEKRLSTINQYTCSPTINYTFQKTSVTANFPQTTTLTELIIRWNLSHNIHSQILDKYWTLDTIQQLALDLQQLHEQSMTSLDHPTLDRRIPDTLHQIFDIECQLNTTPIHSAFINFTTMDNNLHLRFNGMIDPQPETKTMYLEEIADPTISMTILNDTIKILNNAQKETNIIMALAHQNGWQSDPEARLIPKHPNIHLIATIPANTVKYITHRHDGNPLRSKKRIPHEINIWLLHTTHTSIKHNLKREHYFSKLKTLKSKTIHNLRIHPIFDFSQSRRPYCTNKDSRELDSILLQRKQILDHKPIDWTRYHTQTANALKLLPNIATRNHNLTRILDTTEIDIHSLDEAYYTKNAWIYNVINIEDFSSMSYIGQTGMHRQRIRDRHRSWQELERAPLQRLQDHIQEALSQNRKEKKKTSTLYKHMKKDPHN